MESFERAGNPSFTEKAAQAAGRFIGIPAAHAATPAVPAASPGIGARGGFPPDQKFNSRGQPYSAVTMTPAERAQNDASYAWIREHKGGIWGAKAGATAAGPVSTTNNTGGDVNIDRLEVHTRADDAKGIAGSIHQELRDQITTDQFNTGLY
jgi:hypothetical protein